MTTNAKPTSWANRTKAATNAVPLTKSAAKVDRGTRHNGVLESVTPTVFKTGSFGFKIKYSLEGEQRPVFENIVLRSLSDNGTLEPTKYGESSFKRRLQAFGLTADEINNFVIPATPKSANEADYASFPNHSVTIYTVDEEYMGKPQKRVKSVFPKD